MNRRPPIIAYHLIWTTYGTWLPNDPRGSGSAEVVRPELLPLGGVHLGRKTKQPSSRELRDFYERATPRLKHPRIRFDAEQIESIGAGLETAIRDSDYTCYECAILPDHVHILIRRHRHKAEEMIARLQVATRSSLLEAGAAAVDHPVWTEHGWKRFLSSPDAVRAVIRYIRSNIGQYGLPTQRWPFVTEYDGWRL